MNQKMNLQIRHPKKLMHYSDKSVIYQDYSENYIDLETNKSSDVQKELPSNQITNTEEIEKKSTLLMTMEKETSQQCVSQIELSDSKNLSNSNKRKKLRDFLKNVKTKNKPKTENLFLVKPNITEGKKLYRTDRSGIEIMKKNKKKVHITFNDIFDDTPLVEVIEIESFKKYNYIKGLPKEDFFVPVNSDCRCCNLF